ncbi:MAG TPA: hypothetical protein VKW77_06550 [Acidimicrobiales bacterium]|nr:hypothetical protein [Acidimicrobiales bacterium]
MADDLYQTLLASLSAPGTAPVGLPDLIARLGNGDPRVAAVMNLLARRQAEQAEAEAARAGDDEGADSGEPFGAPDAQARAREDRRRRARKLHQMMEAMSAELESLRERNDALAAALGACYLCWGDDPGCRVCHGQGCPGSLRPDRPLFLHYVAPALRRAGLKPGAGSPRPDGGSPPDGPTGPYRPAHPRAAPDRPPDATPEAPDLEKGYRS